MSDWLLNLPVLWMTVVILGITYLLTAGLYLLITRLAVGERARAFKAISPGMLPPLAVLFALLVGFLSAQVWSDADRANTAVNEEAGALREAVLLAAAFPGEPEARLHNLIRQHIQDAVTQEWPAMARRNATVTIAPASLVSALRMALTLDPRDQGQVAAQRQIVVAIESALAARRQRIILSHSTVNWVKWTALLLQAGLTMITIGMVHSDNRAANRIIMAIFAAAAGVAFVLIAAYSRPFSGELTVHPTVLLRVMPEAGAPTSSRDPDVERRRTFGPASDE